jgi:glyoxylase-like metal-dependent hydrolase (beta-lactamase superfamily II)
LVNPLEKIPAWINTGKRGKINFTPMNKIRLVLATLFSVCCFFCSPGQTLAPKLKITPLRGNFFIYTTYQPIDGELFPANGMYAVTSAGVVLFDSPWDTTQFQPLLDSITARHHQKVVICIATHSHDDRTNGLAYYRSKKIKTFTTRKTDSICRLRGNKRAEFLMDQDSVFSVGGDLFETYYGGPGHSSDNIVIWFPKQQILYGGCLIKSVEATGLGFMGDADVKQWGPTLKRIQQKFPNPSFIITGHQDWTDTSSIRHTFALIDEQLKSNK